MAIIAKLFMVPKILVKVKNWPTFMLDYFALLKNKTITYKMRNGLNFYARSRTTDRGIITAIAVLDEHGLDSILLTKKSTVIDIGAQIGIFSFEAAMRAGLVYCYEPEPENYNLLRRNIVLNGMNRRIHAFRQIVWSKQLKKMRIYQSIDNTGGHSAFKKGKKYFEAPATTLPKILDDNNIKSCDLLKIDVEGSEYQILYSTPSAYFLRIKRLFVEYHPAPGKHSNSESLQIFLEKNGYTVNSKEGYIFATRK